MKFNILLVLAAVAVQLMTSAKLRKFPAMMFPSGGSTQMVNMKNIANSDTNAVAVNGGVFGNANAFATGSALNYNQVFQSA